MRNKRNHWLPAVALLVGLSFFGTAAAATLADIYQVAERINQPSQDLPSQNRRAFGGKRTNS